MIVLGSAVETICTELEKSSSVSLRDEIAERRRTIHTDGYSMSIGELMNLYRDEELDIHPEFQRFFRWSDEQKSRLIESLMLGIPVPSIFVQQREDGVWDVIDRLQRLSTIFQLAGLLKDEEDQLIPSLVLRGTKYLPSLKGKRWEGDEENGNYLDRDQQLLIKRSKLDVKIVLRESDEGSKYELFQRLNTGGSPLSDQELRNCLLIMVNRDFYRWLLDLSKDPNFQRCIALTDRSLNEQYDVELIVRFLLFRNSTQSNLKNIGDLGEFLTDNIVDMARKQNFDKEQEEEAFRFVFRQLAEALEDDSFRRYDSNKNRFIGGFLISAFEVLAIGLGSNYETCRNSVEISDIREKAKQLWSNQGFLDAIGSGVRGSSRIPVTIPFGRNYLKQ